MGLPLLDVPFTGKACVKNVAAPWMRSWLICLGGMNFPTTLDEGSDDCLSRVDLLVPEEVGGEQVRGLNALGDDEVESCKDVTDPIILLEFLLLRLELDRVVLSLNLKVLGRV